MWKLILVLAALGLTLLACGPTSSGDADTFCADLGERNTGCWNDDLTTECVELYAECGEAIVVAESCPVQLGC